MNSFMDLFTKAKISPQGKVNMADLKRWGWNALKFSAPALTVFFVQLHMGVEWKAAFLVALLTLYGLLADLFSKFNDGTK